MGNALHLAVDHTPLAMVELRHVRLIVAVLRFGSLTRAGEHLNLTQSALSHQLREMEDRLGVQLFLRVRKKLVPTEFCEAILQPCHDILRAFSSLEHHLVLQSKRGQVIRITTESYTCYNWLPPVLHALEQRYPQARVQIVSEAMEDAENALLDGVVVRFEEPPEAACFDRVVRIDDRTLEIGYRKDRVNAGEVLAATCANPSFKICRGVASAASCAPLTGAYPAIAQTIAACLGGSSASVAAGGLTTASAGSPSGRSVGRHRAMAARPASKNSCAKYKKRTRLALAPRLFISAT